MPSNPDPFDLDQLLARWRAPSPASPASPTPPASFAPSDLPTSLASPAPPASFAPAAPPASFAPLAPPTLGASDPVALLAVLEETLARTFGETSNEFAIARNLIDNRPQVNAVNVPIDAMKVGALVRAMFPSEASSPSAEQLAAYRDRLAEALDLLEDVLDGLLLAAAARG